MNESVQHTCFDANDIDGQFVCRILLCKVMAVCLVHAITGTTFALAVEISQSCLCVRYIIYIPNNIVEIAHENGVLLKKVC